MLHATGHEQDRGDPAEALMREVGAQLREVRMERGEAVEDVAAYLRIKPTYLHAIEAGNLSVMPGRTYALGFLRSYADYLGFDGDDLITQIRSTVENLTHKTRLHIRTPLHESRLPKTPIVVLSLALAAGVYFGWSYLNNGGELVVETVAEVPANLRRLAFDDPPAASAPPATTPASEPPPAVAPAGQAVAEREAPPATGGAVAIEGGKGSRAEILAGPHVVPRGENARAEPGVAPEAAPAAASDPATAATPAPPPAVGAPARNAIARLPRTSPGASAAPSAGGPAGPATRLATAQLPGVAPEAGPPGTRRDERAGLSDPAARHITVPRRTARAHASEIMTDDGPVVPPAAGEAAPPGGAAEVLARLELAPDPAAGEGAPRVHEPQNADARVILRGVESSWIRIESESGDYLRDRTLALGDVFLVPNRDDLVFWTGNAGGVEVIVDGETLPPLGASGSVVRNVRLEPGALRRPARAAAPSGE